MDQLFLCIEKGEEGPDQLPRRRVKTLSGNSSLCPLLDTIKSGKGEKGENGCITLRVGEKSGVVSTPSRPDRKGGGSVFARVTPAKKRGGK